MILVSSNIQSFTENLKEKGQKITFPEGDLNLDFEKKSCSILVNPLQTSCHILG